MNPFVRPRPVECPELRLVGFHNAAGSAAVYEPLARRLPAGWDLLVYELPGRGKRHREHPVVDVEVAVAGVLEALAPWRDAPLALFGHSLGAILAIEAGRALAPEWVVVSGRVAPALHRPAGLQDLDDDSLLETVTAMAARPEQIAAVAELPRFRQRLLTTARADFALTDSYRPAPARTPLTCPLRAFAGDADRWAPPDTMPDWRLETRDRFDTAVFAGGHFYFLDDDFASFAAALVERTPTEVAA